MSRAYKRNYYRILHVQPDAPPQIIQSSYRTLMQKLKQHPDLGGEHANAALINEAYAVLNDPAKRSAYDLTLTQTQSKPTTPVRTEIHPAGAAPAASRRHGHAYAETLHGQCAFCKLPYHFCHIVEADPLCADCASPLLLTKALKSESHSQRAEQRIAHEEVIVFFTNWPQQSGTRGIIKDLSPHGMLIYADQPLTAGQIISASGDLLSTVARVVNCRSLPPPAPRAYGIGVEFITLSLRHGHGTLFSADA